MSSSPPSYVGFGMLTPVVIAVVDQLPEHNTGAVIKEVTEFIFDDAAIVACLLKQWDVPSAIIGTAVGDDGRGHRLAKQLEEWGVQAAVRFTQEFRTPIEVDVSDSGGARTYFWQRSAKILRTLDSADLAPLRGARILYVDWYDGDHILRAMDEAVRLGIPVRVLNSTRPEEAGTIIVEGAPTERTSPVVSVASRSGVRSVRVLGRRMRADADFAAGVLGLLRARGLAPDLVVASEIGVHLVLPATLDPAWLREELGAYGTVELREGRAILCVVGSRLDDGAAREVVLRAIAPWHPELLGLGSTGAGIAAVLPEERLADAVRSLHRQFFEGVPAP